jgi:RNA polymerase sigma-70 factor (ECF subfamily)
VREAGEQLARRHVAALHRFLRRRVPDSVADDLLQRCFLVAQARANPSASRGSVRALLFGIARLELLTHYRSLRREAVSIDEEDGIVIADDATAPIDAMARGEDRRMLARALRRLPFDLQIAIELHYWEQLSSFEIADVLGVPPSTVRSRLQRARKLLEQLLAELEGTPVERTESFATLSAWVRDARARADPPDEPG